MIKYHYQMSGTAAAGQTWETRGTVTTSEPGQFLNTATLALRDTFDQLTQGRAVFGKPGLACDGPYRCTRLVIEELRQ
jgi:hypothetical protein